MPPSPDSADVQRVGGQRVVSQRINRGFNRDRFSTYITDSEVSRSDLARLADVSIAAIRAWEGGKREPDVERLARVCAVLRVEVTDVVNVPDDECMPSDLRIRCGRTASELPRTCVAERGDTGAERPPNGQEQRGRGRPKAR